MNTWLGPSPEPPPLFLWSFSFVFLRRRSFEPHAIGTASDTLTILCVLKCRTTIEGAGRIFLRHAVVAASRWHHDFNRRSFKFVPTQLVSCEGTRVPQGTEDEFWWRIDQNRPTKLPTTAFSDKSHSNSKNRGKLSGEKKGHKIIIHFAVAAHEYSNAVGERFWRDYLKKYLIYKPQLRNGIAHQKYHSVKT